MKSALGCHVTEMADGLAFVDTGTSKELAQYWTLSPDERELLGNKTSTSRFVMVWMGGDAINSKLIVSRASRV